ncbi:hypothetical protein BJ912DRAFT_332781 [Pholiota molesta]|nr:hypothetical protein BJ912DRAFT_332781 [Pholiota molesta]
MTVFLITSVFLPPAAARYNLKFQQSFAIVCLFHGLPLLLYPCPSDIVLLDNSTCPTYFTKTLVERYDVVLQDSINFPNLGMVHHIRSFTLTISMDWHANQGYRFFVHTTIS